jgi:hypothetical protein
MFWYHSDITVVLHLRICLNPRLLFIRLGIYVKAVAQFCWAPHDRVRSCNQRSVTRESWLASE